jgi:hypothetical protein
MKSFIAILIVLSSFTALAGEVASTCQGVNGVDRSSVEDTAPGQPATGNSSGSGVVR